VGGRVDPDRTIGFLVPDSPKAVDLEGRSAFRELHLALVDIRDDAAAGTGLVARDRADLGFIGEYDRLAVVIEVGRNGQGLVQARGDLVGDGNIVRGRLADVRRQADGDE